MKKITLLALILFLSFVTGNAQETISFEAPIYSLGDIHAQNGWTTTGDGSGGFITNQVVTDEFSTEGTFGLKIDIESAFPGQSSPFVGATYTYGTPIAYETAVISADLNMSEQSGTSSDFRIALINDDTGNFITWIRFTFEGDIIVLLDDGAGTLIAPDTLTDWVANTTYNVKIEITGTTANFFIDDVSIFSGIIAADETIGRVLFSHDNFGGFAYVDNFRTNDEELSLTEFEPNNFTKFYDNHSKVLNLNSPQNKLSNIEIYDVLGKRFMNKKIIGNKDSIDLSSLTKGIYLAKVKTEKGLKTFKFLTN